MKLHEDDCTQLAVVFCTPPTHLSLPSAALWMHACLVVLLYCTSGVAPLEPEIDLGTKILGNSVGYFSG